METLDKCSNCGSDGKLRGLYCPKCHNAYRQASRLLKSAELRLSPVAWAFVLRIATRKARTTK